MWLYISDFDHLSILPLKYAGEDAFALRTEHKSLNGAASKRP